MRPVTLLLLPLLSLLTAVWPVGPPRPEVLRGFEPPPGPYAAGHRGVDLAAPPGTPVAAPAAGTVAFAGPVGGRGVLTLILTGTGLPPLRTTYGPVEPLVEAGTAVRPGEVVARVAAGGHCPRSCLHWGLLRGSRYLDPLALLRGGRPRLLPTTGPMVPSVPTPLPVTLSAAGPTPRGQTPRTPPRAIETAASAMTAGSSAAPSSIRRTAASTTPWRSIASRRG